MAETTLTSGNDVFVGDDDENDVIRTTSANLSALDDIDGLGQTDEDWFGDRIEIIGAANLVDAQFEGVLDIETIKLTSLTTTQSIVLGAFSQAAGIHIVNAFGVTGTVTVNAAARTDSVSMVGNAGVARFTGGSADDFFAFRSAQLASTDRIDGGAGFDTIEIMDRAVIADAAFTLVTNVEALFVGDATEFMPQFGLAPVSQDGSSITLGARSVAAGITEVTFEGLGRVTVNLAGRTVGTTVYTNYENDTVIAGGVGADDEIFTSLGNDTIRFLAANLTSGDTVYGGAGYDRLEITNAATGATLTDGDFAGVREIERLVLRSTATGQKVELGVDSDLTGLQTVDVSLTTGTVTVDASGRETGIEIVSNLGTNILTGGTGDDVFIFRNAYFTSADKVAGGGDEFTDFDTIAISDTAAITDAKFSAANQSDIQNLRLMSNAATQTVTLGANSVAVGIIQVDASLVTNTAAKITVNGSARATGLDVLGSAGADTFIATSGFDEFDAGSGNDTYQTTVAKLTLADVIDGGDGTDRLLLTGGGTLADSQLQNVSAVERIVLAAGANWTVTLAAESQAGIVELDGSAVGGTNTLAVNASARSDGLAVKAGAGVNDIEGGSGEDTITIARGTLTALDAIDGGDGLDTLVITGGGTVTSAALAGIQGIEAITLQGTATSITLTAAMISDDAPDEAGNFLQITSGSGSDTINASAVTASGVTVLAGTGVDRFTGSAQDDVLVFSRPADMTVDDRFTAGQGYDRLVFLTPGTIGAAALANMRGVDEILLSYDVDPANLLAAGNTVTLSNAFVASSDERFVDIHVQAGVWGNDVINTSAVDFLGGVNISTALGNDRIIGGAGSELIDFVMWDGALTLDRFDTVSGGLGFDTIRLLTSGGDVEIDDDAFTNVSGIERLRIRVQDGDLGDEAFILLGLKSQAAGIGDLDLRESAGTILTAYDRTDPLNVRMSDDGTDDLVLTQAEDTIQVFVEGAFDASDFIDGGGEEWDKFRFEHAVSLTDALFENVIFMEEIELRSRDNGQSVTLGADAENAGILQVDASRSGSVTVNASAMSSGIEVIGSNAGDTITGTSGDDRLEARGGNDTITTGAGIDEILFRTVSDGVDTVTDFDAALDQLYFRASQFTQGAGMTYLGASAFTATGVTEVRFDGGTSSLQIDVDGDGDIDWQSVFTGETAASFDVGDNILLY